MCAAALVWPHGPAGGQTIEIPVDVVSGEIGARLDEYLARLVPFGFSGSVLVSQRGALLLHRGYGAADRDGNRPLRPDMPLVIGSLSKQFTAAAILALETDGRLRVGDSLVRWLPDLPPDKHGITIHQLLTHTSGLPYHTNRRFLEERPREDIYREMAGLQLESAPGERWHYSSPGYTLLAAVIERASGRSYEEYLAERLFGPAGMSGTGFMSQRSWIETIPAVHSYMDDRDEGPIQTFPEAPKGVGSGSVVTTVGELYRWDRALADARVLPREQVDRLFHPHVERSQGFAYGYGWEVIRTVRGTTVIRHAGDLNGYNAEFRRYVDEGVVIILTSGARRAGRGVREAVMNDLSRIVTGDSVVLAPVTVAAVSRGSLRDETFVGRNGGVLRVAPLGIGLMAGAEGRPLVRLLLGADAHDPAADSLAAAGIQVRFVPSARHGEFVAYDMFAQIPVTLRVSGRGAGASVAVTTRDGRWEGRALPRP